VSNVNQRDVLELVLLQLLAEHPDGLSIAEVYERVSQRHEFPETWSREIPTTGGYDELARLGYSDWRDVPQEKLVQLVKTEPQWQNELRWARNELRKKGQLDADAPRGVWRLTSGGMKAAGKIALATLPPEMRRIATPRQAAKPTTRPERPAAAGTDMREALIKKLVILTSSMPLDDLELLVDIARAVRVRSLTEDAPKTAHRA
jgi:hypothetical protein